MAPANTRPPGSKRWSKLACGLGARLSPKRGVTGCTPPATGDGAAARLTGGTDARACAAEFTGGADPDSPTGGADAECTAGGGYDDRVGSGVRNELGGGGSDGGRTAGMLPKLARRASGSWLGKSRSNEAPGSNSSLSSSVAGGSAMAARVPLLGRATG